MATEFCQKCKQAHPGHACDYDQKGDCAETIEVTKDGEVSAIESREKETAVEKS